MVSKYIGDNQGSYVSVVVRGKEYRTIGYYTAVYGTLTKEMIKAEAYGLPYIVGEKDGAQVHLWNEDEYKAFNRGEIGFPYEKDLRFAEEWKRRKRDG